MKLASGAAPLGMALEHEGEALGKLEWARSGGSLARASCEDAAWTFKRVGLWRPRITIRLADENEEMGAFAPNLAGAGSLAFDAGPQFGWMQAWGWNRHEWAWSLATGSTAMSFRAGAERTIEVRVGHQELGGFGVLLALFGGYLIESQRQESSEEVRSPVVTPAPT